MKLKYVMLVCLAGGAIGAINNPAQAEFDKRIYIGASGGVSMLEPDPNDTGYENDSETDAGGKIFVGWDFSERFALEAYYAALGDATLRAAEGQTLDPESGSISYDAYGASVLYHIYNTEGLDGRLDRTGLSAFVKGGVGGLDTSSSTLDIEALEDFNIMIGAGVEYGFNSGLAIRGEIEGYDTDAQFASLGVLWRFGGGGSYQPAPTPLPAEIPAEEPELVIDTAPADFDEDGVPNSVDACPGSRPGVVVNEDGCPLFDLTLEGVNFASGSAELTAESLAVLDQVAADLQRYPNVRITVAAHTDNQGDAAANLELSKQRALSVARYLVSKGIGARRLRPEAYGESTPLVSNATAEGRAQNRRVELSTITE